MLGPPKPRRLDDPVAGSLEALVPRDSFYRHLEAALDLGFVREWARERYACRGRPSIDPVDNKQRSLTALSAGRFWALTCLETRPAFFVLPNSRLGRLRDAEPDRDLRLVYRDRQLETACETTVR